MKNVLTVSLLALSFYCTSAYCLPLNQNLLEKPIDSVDQNPSFFKGFKKNTPSITSTLLIRTGVGKNTILQGLTLDSSNQQLYTIHSFGKPETPVINRFSYTQSKQLTALDAQKPSLYLGHQGLTVDPITHQLWASAGAAVENKGLYIVGFQYQPDSEIKDPILIKVFNEDYDKETYTMPVITPKRDYLVVRNKKDKHTIIRVFKIKEDTLNTSRDLSTSALYEWKIDNNFHKGKYAFQGMSSDGKYVYLLGGSANELNKKIYVYTLDGQPVQQLSAVTVGGRDSLVKANQGGNHWEPEGIAIDSIRKEMILLFAVGTTKNSFGQLYKIPFASK